MKKTGFDYYLEKNILKDYRKKSIKSRLRWLYQANKLRKHYPKKTVRIQEKFRKGEI